MIDFAKFHIDKMYEVNIKERLEIILDVNDTTGDIIKQTSEYKNMKFLFRSFHIEVKGSFHKLFNDGLHNHNDFSFSNLSKTILEFCQYFGIPPGVCHLKNLEVGFNISPQINTNDLLDNILIFKNKEPSIDRSNKKHFIEFKTQRYYLKIYNKGLQFQLRKNTLRVEIKFRKMCELNAFGIETLKDLIIYSNIKWLTDRVLSTFERVLMYDDTLRLDNVKCTGTKQAKEIKILRNGRNPKYWIKEKRIRSNSTYYKKLNRFLILRDLYNQNNYHLLVLSLLKQKRKELLTEIVNSLTPCIYG